LSHYDSQVQHLKIKARAVVRLKICCYWNWCYEKVNVECSWEHYF